MKASWLYYDYLRRWWLLLLVGPTIGAILGFAYYNQIHHPAQYAAAGTVAIKDPTWHLEHPGLQLHHRAPEVEVVINSGAKATEQAAVDSIMSTAINLADYAEGVTEVRNLSIKSVPDYGVVFWKPVVMGAVLAILLVIGGIYIWEDATAYRRDLQTKAL